MMNVALRAIESMMLPSWGYEFNAGYLSIPSNIKIIQTPVKCYNLE
jgi:hypothetical protein